MTEYAPGQSNYDIPERGWDTEPRLWYYEGQPDQHYELLALVGEDAVLRPIDGSPVFTCNGSFVWPVNQRERP